MQENNHKYMEDWRGKLLQAVEEGNEAIINICINAINSLFPDIQYEANYILANTVHNPITGFMNHRNSLYLNLMEKELREMYQQTFSSNAISQLFYAPNRNSAITIARIQADKYLVKIY